MKVLIVSDIHFDFSEFNQKMLYEVKKVLQKEKPNVFVVLGDLAEKNEVLNKCLNELNIGGIKKIFIPGNHDFFKEKGVSTQQKYDYVLKEVCSNNDFIYLQNDYIKMNNTIILGTSGWFDFSFRRHELAYDIQEYENPNSDFNKELHLENVKIEGISNIELCNTIVNQISEKINSIKDKNNKLLFLSHMVPFRECLDIYDRVPKNPLIAYEGSSNIGEILIKSKSDFKEIVCVHGHSHDNNIDLNIDGIKVLCKAIGEIENEDEFMRKKMNYIVINI